MNEQQPTETELEPIAIVSMACRFPNANNIDEFWKILRQGEEAISRFTEDELLDAGVTSLELNQSEYVKAKAIVDGIEDFDPHLFGYSPREAELIDPQQRILLECAWQVLEQAALNPDSYQGDIASYVGVGMNTYLLKNILADFARKGEGDYYQMMLGGDKDFAATRLAYKLNLKGSAVAVNTACSTSLVAVHYACQGLWDYQCDAALAGGASFSVPQKEGYLYQQGGIRSPDGHCRTFDEQANGTVPSSGAGLVLLKRLEDALADNDTIYGLIKGSAVNNDGADKIGFTAPSVNGQAAVIAEAMAVANVAPETIDYIETHGTATPLGDPIEVAALKLAFANDRNKQHCALASLKSNFGHMDAAAGIAGLIKATLALYHQEIPASLHFNQANSKIDFVDSPFYVNQKLQPWSDKNTPRRASVSSFGIGGTNAHVVLEQAPHQIRSVEQTVSTQSVVLSLCAKTPQALQRLSADLAQHLTGNPQLNLTDIAYSLAVGRRELEVRAAIVVDDTQQAIRALHNIGHDALNAAKKSPAVVFMFPGQGSQKIRMGQELYEIEPVFKRYVDECFDSLKSIANIDLKPILFPETENEAAAEQQLNTTEITQPALFVIEYSLAQLFIFWGVKPAAMIGHSLGEYVAACVAGVLDFEHALKLVAQRAALMQTAPTGAMLAVMSSEAQCQQWLNDELSLAAVNGERQCVISGSKHAIDQLQTKLNNQEIVCQTLTVSHAFHSPLMQSAAKELEQTLSQIDIKANSIPYISNLTGSWIESADLNADYWQQHMLQPVKFEQGIKTLCAEFEDLIVLEVGFGKALQGLVKSVLQAGQQILPTLLASEQYADKTTINALAELWSAGVKVDWNGVFSAEQHQRIALPTYPFQRQRCWLDAAPIADSCQSPCVEQETDLSQWFSTVNWQRRLVMPEVVQEKADCFLAFVNAPLNDAPWIQVKMAAQYQQVNEQVFTLNPESEDDFKHLLRDLSLTDKQSLELTYSWNLSAQNDSTDFAQAYLGLMSFCKIVNQQHPTLKCRITVITQGLFEVTAGEAGFSPVQALMLGPIKVVPQEYPQIECRLVDLELKQQVLPDLTRLDFNQQVLAWRNDCFWLPKLENIKLPETSPEHNKIKQQGCYVITGGLGGIGLSLATSLARKYQAKLVLTTRRDFPEKSQWQSYLSLDAQTEQGSFQPLTEILTDKLSALETEFAIQGMDSYSGLNELLERLCNLHLLRFFNQAGVAPYGNKSWSLQLIKQQLSVLDKFDKFILLLLEILQRDNLIRWQGKSFLFSLQSADDWDIEIAQIEQRIKQEYAGFSALADMVAYCVEKYPKALSGQIEAISVLYPDGDRNLITETAEDTVEHNNHRVYYHLLKEYVQHTVDNSHDVVRILEVGGGSGILTGLIAPDLQGKNVEYYFTDIGKSFVLKVQKAAQKQGLYFMRFSVFDIFKDPVEQGFDLQSFDIIYGLDVVHATPDIKRAVSQLSRLLKPGGDLCLVETAPVERWNEMVWGLAEGWWYYEDHELRSGTTPLLKPNTWQKLMDDSGLFSQVNVFPTEPEKRLNTDCCLVMARAAGQKQKTDRNSNTRDRQQTVTIQVLMDMERAGAEVVVCTADVCDKQAMQAVFKRAKKQFGTVNGLFHTAASDSRGYIDIQNKDRSLEELKPKVLGTQVLQQCIDFKSLDFVLLFSSLNSITGGQGNIAYTAANSYLDAFAHYCRHYKTGSVHTVDWDRWQSLGQAVDFEDRMQKNQGTELIGGISSQEGFELIQRVLASAYPQLLVHTGRVDSEVQDSVNEIQQGSDQQAHQRPQLTEQYVAPSTEMQILLAGIWSEVLGIQQLGVDDDFYALGGDSLIAIRVMARLKELLNLNLEVKLIFENSTIATLAAQVEGLQAALFVTSDGDEAEAEAEGKYEGGVI